MRRGAGAGPGLRRRRWLLLLAVLAALCRAAAGSGGRRRAASLGEMLREVEALMEDTQHKLRNAVQEVSEARRGGRRFLSAPPADSGPRAARLLLAAQRVPARGSQPQAKRSPAPQSPLSVASELLYRAPRLLPALCAALAVRAAAGVERTPVSRREGTLQAGV